MFVNSLIISVISLVLSWLYSFITKDEKSTFMSHVKNALITLVSVILVNIFLKQQKGIGYLNQPIKTGVPNF